MKLEKPPPVVMRAPVATEHTYTHAARERKTFTSEIYNNITAFCFSFTPYLSPFLPWYEVYEEKGYRTKSLYEL